MGTSKYFIYPSNHKKRIYFYLFKFELMTNPNQEFTTLIITIFNFYPFKKTNK